MRLTWHGPKTNDRAVVDPRGWTCGFISRADVADFFLHHGADVEPKSALDCWLSLGSTERIGLSISKAGQLTI
jgi:hypothetical protein